MEFRKRHSFTGWALGLGAVCLAGLSHAAPLIVLPAGEVARMSYAGHELFIDTNRNSLADTGDVFEGIAIITRIQGAASGTDFSAQLMDKELTSRFRFSIIDHSSDFSHLEFGLLPGDFFSFYVGQGSTKNFDPSAPDAVARASDGQFWLGIQPGLFFESVNDRQPDGTTLNRAWADVTINNTGFLLDSDFLRTILGRDAQHIAAGQPHGDHAVQAIFDNRIAGFSPFAPQFTFSIFGEFDVFAVPEPATWLLVLTGMGLVYRFRSRKHSYRLSRCAQQPCSSDHKPGRSRS